MFKSYLKIAWRSILKDKQFTLLNLLGLSTGLACILLIFFWVNDELQTDRFNAKDSQLYEVLKKGVDGTGAIRVGDHTQGLLAQSMAAELPDVEYAVAVRKDRNASILSAAEKHLKITHQFAGKDFFNVFTYSLADGHTNKVTGVTGVFLSDQLAIKLFNTTRVTGKTVNWDFKDNEVDFSGVYTIAGVYKSPPANATNQFDLLLPFELYAAKHAGGMGDITFWGSNMVSTYLILKAGTNIAAFDKKIKNFSTAKIKSLYPGNSEMEQYEGTMFTRRFSDAYLHNNFVDGKPSGGRIEYIKLFSIVAAFILVIACINFMNLSTAKASSRFKEIGIKKVVGASRRSLVVQYIAESMIMAFAALLVALLFVQLLFPAFREITGKDLHLQLNAALIACIAGITLLTGLIAGSYPALYLSRFKPVLILKGKTNTSTGEAWVRKGLVVFQFSISVILIVSVLVVYQQMKLIQTTNLGYSKDNIIRFSNEGNLTRQQGAFLAAIKKIPGVLHASGMEGDLLGRAFRWWHQLGRKRSQSQPAVLWKWG
ncbi:MAG TPA: ABC transporter permease [Chitinophagaceae bacterium]|nr:ABC transporter permease [Chitinophagaceae bacterium]